MSQDEGEDVTGWGNMSQDAGEMSQDEREMSWDVDVTG